MAKDGVRMIQLSKKTRGAKSAGSFAMRLWRTVVRYKFIYMLILPGVVLLLVFDFYPLYFLQIAFKKYNIYAGFEKAKFIGLANFEKIFRTKYFLQAFNNTVIISCMKMFIGFPVPIILALVMNEFRNKYLKRTVQTVIYLPHFLSWIIVAAVWTTLLSPTSGLVNEIRKLMGLSPIFYMADKSVFRWVLLFVDTWKEAGWGTIVYMAAIAGIDQGMYEAALIDGANRLKQTIYITLPSILPTVIVVFILSLAKVLNVFELVMAMYNPVVAEVSETIDTYVYQIGLVNGDMSFATAVGLFKNVISLVLVLSTNFVAKKLKGASVI